jgi:hypothetical protein
MVCRSFGIIAHQIILNSQRQGMAGLSSLRTGAGPESY